MIRRTALLLLAAAALAGCQKEAPPPPASGKSAALRTMEAVAIAAHRCWIAAKDPAFKAYRFANELDSMSGRPRFLLVPAGNYGGRPLLVVQASGPAGRLEAFGPLMQGEQGARITADLNRWRGSNPSCAAAA